MRGISERVAIDARLYKATPATGLAKIMKIAVIGTGIAGMVAAHRLHRDHDITVFEANDYIGGHTRTVDVALDDERYAIDTGFIVFNNWTYPNFVKLLDELGVAYQPSRMSFSVQCERSGLEYNGTSLNTLFAQRRNLLRPSFHRMIADILRFNHSAPRLLDHDDSHMTLGEYLQTNGYSHQFIEHYIMPMGAAIWSADPAHMQNVPARYFVQFFHNHGMLSVNDRPLWQVVTGGSRCYTDKLTAPYRHRIRLSCPVTSVHRLRDHVEVRLDGGKMELFDHVFIACHSDQALRLLPDATTVEREVLGAIPYQENEAVLHTDAELLPKRRLAWAAWNYHILPHAPGRVAVTYNMNILQSVHAPSQFCVTLNHSEAINPHKIINRIVYHHPIYTAASVAAQKRQSEINGTQRTYFCGAYWGYGFHEDGVKSALIACEDFRKRTNDEQLYLRRAS